MPDVEHPEPRLLEQGRDGRAVEVDEVHVHEPGPASAQEPRHQAPGVDGGEVEPAARHEQHAGRRQLLPRIGQVLDHVPQGEHVVAVGGVGPDLERLAMDGEALGARQSRRPAGELEPLGAEPPLPGHLEEVAAVGAHVEEAAAAGRPQRPDHLAEGEDPVLPLGHVERVDDPGVGRLQGLVLRHGPLEEQAAVVASVDGRVMTVAEAGAAPGAGVERDHLAARREAEREARVAAEDAAIGHGQERGARLPGDGGGFPHEGRPHNTGRPGRAKRPCRPPGPC